jgi:hypothetical protein
MASPVRQPDELPRLRLHSHRPPIVASLIDGEGAAFCRMFIAWKIEYILSAM